MSEISAGVSSLHLPDEFSHLFKLKLSISLSELARALKGFDPASANRWLV